MSNTKKFLIIVFTVMLVISLQFNTSLTHKMNNGFSLTQLMENIFVPDATASTITNLCTEHIARYHCLETGTFWVCIFDWIPTNYCDED